MAITFRSFSNVATPSPTLTCIIPKPAGLSVGDLQLAHIAPTGTSTTVTPPSGWIQVLYNKTPSANYPAYLFSNVASTSDANASSFTFTTSSSVNTVGAILVYEGVDISNDGNNAIDVKNFSNGTGTSLTTTGFINSANDMIILFATLSAGVPDPGIGPYTLQYGDPGLVEKYDF
jgi:hypothetical protein